MRVTLQDKGTGVGVFVGVFVGTAVGAGQGSVAISPFDAFLVAVTNLSIVVLPSGIRAIEPDVDGMHTPPSSP